MRWAWVLHLQPLGISGAQGAQMARLEQQADAAVAGLEGGHHVQRRPTPVHTITGAFTDSSLPDNRCLIDSLSAHQSRVHNGFPAQDIYSAPVGWHDVMILSLSITPKYSARCSEGGSDT